MKTLNVQLQPVRSPGLNAAEAVARLRALADGSWVSAGEDSGPYINVGFDAADPAGLWAAIRKQLRADAALARATIVVCQIRASTAGTTTCCFTTSTRTSRWTRWRKAEPGAAL